MSTRPVPDGSTGPGFLLCRNDSHVIGHGRAGAFTAAGEAAEALRSGAASAGVGALPFDVRERSALTVPEHLEVADGPWQPGPMPPVPPARVAALEPPLAEHRARVAAAVTRLADPADPLAKVVLARSLRVRTQAPMTPWQLAGALRAGDRAGSVFVADLGPAGEPATLVGASPEVLIRKHGRRVSAHPLAGSAPRGADAQSDEAIRAGLADSAKDLAEHAYVVRAITDALAPLCRTLDAPQRPSLLSTPAMWHLGTRIHGELADPSLTALDLALAVHPTPAICGTPTPAARDHILAVEEPRGFYAGAVGWTRAGAQRNEPGWGDGEWMVTIRCARVDAAGRDLRTWAGGGIVADSDPDAEVAETQAKSATVLRALGIPADAAAGLAVSSS